MKKSLPILFLIILAAAAFLFVNSNKNETTNSSDIEPVSTGKKINNLLSSSDPVLQETGKFLQIIQKMYDERYAEEFPALTEIDKGTESPDVTYSSKEKIDYQIQLFERAVIELEDVEEVRVDLYEEFYKMASEAKEIPDEYKEGFLSEIKVFGDTERLQANRNRTGALLGFYEAVLSHHYFMKENFDYYEIQNKVIIFNTDSQVKVQYEESTNKIRSTYAEYLETEKILE